VMMLCILNTDRSSSRNNGRCWALVRFRTFPVVAMAISLFLGVTTSLAGEIDVLSAGENSGVGNKDGKGGLRDNAVYVEVFGRSGFIPNVHFEHLLDDWGLSVGLGYVPEFLSPATFIMVGGFYYMARTGNHGFLWQSGVTLGRHEWGTPEERQRETLFFLLSGPAYEYRTAFLFRLEILLTWVVGEERVVLGIPGVTVLPGIVLGTAW